MTSCKVNVLRLCDQSDELNEEIYLNKKARCNVLV